MTGGDDLFSMRESAPAPAGAARMTREEIFARHGVVDLKSPQAHRCFRCEASTGLGFGFLHRPGGRLVFACEAHFGELM
jgi:hypothetical protein